MKNKVELPLTEPIYSTYNYYGTGGAIISENPTIRNWYLNEAVNLLCNRRFLSGFTTPEINIQNASWSKNPYFEMVWYKMKFAKGYINPIIRECLKQGYYVCFGGIDDYYVEGKSWYHERHFKHDGLICGFDQEKKTYSILAYDKNWIYRKFYCSQESFDKGRRSMFNSESYGHIYALKPKSEIVKFDPEAVIRNLKEYLNSSFDMYPIDGEGEVHGIIVHDYIVMYVKKLYDGSIPYERMDRRVFRLIWEHKKAMLERIEKLEVVLGLEVDISHKYKVIVSEADMIRMMYASHNKKRRDSLLLTISSKLLNIKQNEEKLLHQLVDRIEGVAEK